MSLSATDPASPGTPPATPGPAAGRRSLEEMLPIYAGVTVILLMLVVVFFAIRQKQRRQAVAERERHLIDFQLIDRTGRSVSRADLSNQFLVVSFVFTSCSLTCLQVNRHLSTQQGLVAGQDDVRLVSITVDPRTDTPPVLAEFANRFGADTNRWLFLTGDRSTVENLIGTSFLERGTTPAAELMPGGFLNTERLVVVDRQGRIRRHFDGLKASSVGAITNTLQQLRAEPP